MFFLIHRMRTLPFLPQNFQEISDHLNSGLPIILPTETSYGFSGNIFSKTAIQTILRIKNRENKKNKAFLVLVDSFATLQNFSEISHLSEQNKEYIKAHSDAFSTTPPTTFILPKNTQHHPALTEYFPQFTNIGIRIPQYPPLIGFLKSHTHPLFSTSANLPGHAPLHKSEEIKMYFKHIPQLLFVDAGDLEKNPPSSIIEFNENGEKIIIR